MAVPLLKEIGLLLFIIFVCVIFVGSIILFLKAIKTSNQLNKTDIYGYSLALFFLFIAIGYIVRIYFMFFLALIEELGRFCETFLFQ